MKYTEYTFTPEIIKAYRSIKTQLDLVRQSGCDYPYSGTAGSEIKKAFSKLYYAFDTADLSFFFRYPKASELKRKLITMDLSTDSIHEVMLFLVEFLYQETKGVITKEQRDASLSISLAYKCKQAFGIIKSLTADNEKQSVIAEAILYEQCRRLHSHIQHFPLEWNIPLEIKDYVERAILLLATIDSDNELSNKALYSFCYSSIMIIEPLLMCNVDRWFSSL